MSNGAAVTNSGSITGGVGGDALNGNGPSGNGGSGAELFGGSLTNAAGKTIKGGAGGQNADENGGIGGTGVVVRSGADATVDNSGALRGGSGGVTVNGSGGNGGNGVVMNGGILINRTTGSIFGGGGGQSMNSSAGSGGAGVLVTGDNAKIINGGYISGGDAFANAVTVNGNDNRVELQAGSIFNGNVVASGTGNVLALGGDTNSSVDFNVSDIGTKYTGFDSFEKTGTSNWSIAANSGQPGQITNWTLTGGSLTIGDFNSLGITGSELTFNGGTLRYTGSANADVTRTIHWSANGGGF